MSEPSLSCTLCGIPLKNPFMLASGIWGTSAALLERAALAGAGAVTSKSCGLEPRDGHPNPTVLDWGHGLINAVGLPNPGASAQVEVLRDAKARLQPLGVPLIASIFGRCIEEFGEVAAIVAEAEPDFIEVNISCPNVQAEFGIPFALQESTAAAVSARVRRVSAIPLIVKLSPNTPHLKAIARAVETVGADAIAAVNTLGPGMVIDVHARRPVLANLVGGVSGPAILPIAVRCVYDVCSAVDIPVIGIGGVCGGEDAAQMLMAGATAVGLGSVLHYRGESSFGRVADELKSLMREEGYAILAEMRGAAHER